MKRILIVTALIGTILAACGPAAAPTTPAPTQAPVAASNTAIPTPPATETPAAVTPTATATATSIPDAGPDNFPSGINPLTGLPVSDPTLLGLPAVLISVTNFPASARPQAGLSTAAMVFEFYVGEGTTRFLAVYYGDFPKATVPEAGGALVDKVGPIRSGRLPYIYIRDAFQWSCLIYASATQEIRAQLKGCYIANGTGDVNSAFVDVTKMKALAQGNLPPNQPFNYSGNLFSTTVPAGGQAANTLKVYYSLLNQSMWTYDAASGKYLRSENSPTAADQFTPTTDRLTGQQLAFSNVIVLDAPHTAVKPTIIDIDLSLGNTGSATLFRDGQAIPIQWTTTNGAYEAQTGLRRPIRFTDAAGNPVGLKPGNTWINVMTPYSTLEQPAPGAWEARFYAPSGSS